MYPEKFAFKFTEFVGGGTTSCSIQEEKAKRKIKADAK
jgi:hypothetical protein